MKKVFALSLAALFLTLFCAAACAETASVGGVELTIPRGWQVGYHGDDGLVMLQETGASMRSVYVNVSDIESWDSLVSTEDGLSAYLQVMAIGVLSRTGMEDKEQINDRFVTLKDGGLAWKAVYKTEDGATFGCLLMAAAGRSITAYVNVPDGEADMCMKILSDMLLPMQVQEEAEVAGLTLGIPAGWESGEAASGALLLADAYGNIMEVVALDPPAVDGQEEMDEAEQKSQLVLLTYALLNGFEISDLQAQELAVSGAPALVCSADVVSQGQEGTIQTLVTMSGNTPVYAMLYCRGDGAKYAPDVMDVLVYPANEGKYVMTGDVKLAYPEGFLLTNIDNTEEKGIAVFSDQTQDTLCAVVYPLSQEELAKDARQLLKDIALETLGEEQAASMRFIFDENEGGFMLRTVGWKKTVDHIPTALSRAWILAGDQQVGIVLSSPYGDADQTDEMLLSILPAARADGFAVGQATLHIPSGYTQEQDGEWTKFRNLGVEIGVMSIPMPDNLRDMTAGMGEQTGLEIFLSMWAAEAGLEGVTIEYANENGVHSVRSSGILEETGTGFALLLDGDTLTYLTVAVSEEREAAAYALVNQVLGTR
ncbi:MAG: hypothetical protein IKU34_09790 [Clostridia bacterium]|nr:hypothetical protein [Clostridia bacterium]